MATHDAITDQKVATDQPLVSVVMPVLNPTQVYFKAAIRSILDQTHANLEVIIVEDPGRFSGADVIATMNDPRLRYVRNPRQTSFAGQLNRGLAMARGRFTARMDADDIAHRQRIEYQLAFMGRHPELSVLGTDLKLIDAQGRLLGWRRYPRTPHAIARGMASANAIAHPTVMMRTHQVKDCGGYRTGYGPAADYELWCRMLASGRRFGTLPRPLLAYRIHDAATKKAGLKTTLAATLAIKQQYFKNRPALWGPRHEMRYQLERLLRRLPEALIFNLFLLSLVKRQP